MNLQRKQEIMRECLQDACIGWKNLPHLIFTSHLRTTAGRAITHRVGSKIVSQEIEMNIAILNLNPLIAGLDTLFHELAHLIVERESPGNAHGEVWKKIYADLTGKSTKEVQARHALIVPKKKEGNTATVKF